MCMYLNLVGALYLNPMYTSIATPDGQQLRKITPPDPNPIPHVPKQFLSRDGRIINLIRAWLPARRTKPNGGAHNTAHPPSQERPWKKTRARSRRRLVTRYMLHAIFGRFGRGGGEKAKRAKCHERQGASSVSLTQVERRRWRRRKRGEESPHCGYRI